MLFAVCVLPLFFRIFSVIFTKLKFIPFHVFNLILNRKSNFIPFFRLNWRECRQVLKTHEPVYQAIWVDNIDFDEVLISPAMIQDHMPDTVLAALNKVSK